MDAPLVSFPTKAPPIHLASFLHISVLFLLAACMHIISSDNVNEPTALEEVVLHVDLDGAVALGVGDAGEDCKDARINERHRRYYSENMAIAYQITACMQSKQRVMAYADYFLPVITPTFMVSFARNNSP